MQHMKISCIKRPFPPVKCRLQCGEEFHGGLHRMLQVEPIPIHGTYEVLGYSSVETLHRLKSMVNQLAFWNRGVCSCSLIDSWNVVVFLCRIGSITPTNQSRHLLSWKQSEEERIDHEHELCPHRLLHCAWEECEEMVIAKDRRKHRDEHVVRTGVFLYTVPGKYNYRVNFDDMTKCHTSWQ